MSPGLMKSKDSIWTHPTDKKGMVEPLDIRMENRFELIYGQTIPNISLEVMDQILYGLLHLRNSILRDGDLLVVGHIGKEDSNLEVSNCLCPGEPLLLL